MKTTKTIRVKCGPNGPVFLEGVKRRIDPETGLDVNVVGPEPMELPSSPYYRKRVRSGDLVLVEAEVVKSESMKKPTPKRED
ncbi:MAG: hypothetical protein ACEQSX_03625 [Baekduiaceae bacterium]